MPRRMAPKSSVVRTRIGATMFGSRWRTMIRRVGAPRARAASMYGFSRSARTALRTTRAYWAHQDAVIAISTLRSPGPSTPVTASASRKVGNPRRTSTTRLIRVSTAPPK